MSATDRGAGAVSLAGSPAASLVVSPAVSSARSLIASAISARTPLRAGDHATSAPCDICCRVVVWS
jgi:hypothetical protein